MRVVTRRTAGKAWGKTAEEVTPERLLSALEYTPFAGLKLTGWPARTMLRGETVLAGGAATGDPRGSVLPRPPRG